MPFASVAFAPLGLCFVLLGTLSVLRGLAPLFAVPAVSPTNLAADHTQRDHEVFSKCFARRRLSLALAARQWRVVACLDSSELAIVVRRAHVLLSFYIQKWSE